MYRILTKILQFSKVIKVLTYFFQRNYILDSPFEIHSEQIHIFSKTNILLAYFDPCTKDRLLKQTPSITYAKFKCMHPLFSSHA